MNTTTNDGSYLSVDPGNLKSGIGIVNRLQITYAANMDNEDVMKIIRSREKGTVVLIEDMKPYCVPLTQQTIDTCKFIGKMCYFLESKKIKYELITRHQVKKWVFDMFPTVVLERICKKIEYKNKRNNDGKLRRPSYVYVDDRIVIAAMKDLWKIPTPKPGKRNGYGLSEHSWQSLAVMSYYLYGRVGHQLSP
jgi:hypothetical protein